MPESGLSKGLRKQHCSIFDVRWIIWAITGTQIKDMTGTLCVQHFNIFVNIPKVPGVRVKFRPKAGRVPTSL